MPVRARPGLTWRGGPGPSQESPSSESDRMWSDDLPGRVKMCGVRVLPVPVVLAYVALFSVDSPAGWLFGYLRLAAANNGLEY